ncbi:hypothetical protein [Streptosporangium sp. NPDC000509]|uniref:hypothetical protein n=1 Tax=Streptosporangium sp. NPDC000509 TaxID=3366186 RepID=UPI00369360F5
MPIPLPNLDDRSYADLMAQAQALIPALDPAWTNFNPSDPGITLVELLAWLTEMQLFQVNQVTPASTEKFLKLLNGPDWRKPPDVSLDAAIRQTLLAQRRRYRAVTADDYEWLALNAWPQTPEAGRFRGGGRLARVHCIPRRDLSATDPAKRRADAPAHVSLVVLPAEDGENATSTRPRATSSKGTDTPTVVRGAPLTVHYSTAPGTVSSTNWVGVYLDDDGATIGKQGAIVWTYAPGTGGSVTLDTGGVPGPGRYAAWYLYNDGYTALADPLIFTLT